MTSHIPVMVKEVVGIYRRLVTNLASPVFIDATLGAGGHASEVLAAFPGCSLIGFEQDAQARALAESRLREYGSRMRIVSGNFREMKVLLDDASWPGADGILFDLGVSNMQLVTPERGFSYQESGPLDMRMNADLPGTTARSLIEECDVRTLARIFREFGEERYAFQIARGIVRARERGRTPATTEDLTALIREILPAPVQRKMGGHPARRVFQALRIAVNSEIEALDEGLDAALDVARDGAVIVVLSYHSLEDRMVKRRFLRWQEEGRGVVLIRRPLVPSEEETESNRSARSAKLRAFKAEQSKPPQHAAAACFPRG